MLFTPEFEPFDSKCGLSHLHLFRLHATTSNYFKVRHVQDVFSADQQIIDSKTTLNNSRLKKQFHQQETMRASFLDHGS